MSTAGTPLGEKFIGNTGVSELISVGHMNLSNLKISNY